MVKIIEKTVLNIKGKTLQLPSAGNDHINKPCYQTLGKMNEISSRGLRDAS